ncbi:hypothetical protein GOODEAATRI_032413 [Goodea atripinnis]|uniref:Uncharacterized protein n=1 Tax=Goodea atripinnis TaxID=208336 RepID=A0ABV0NFK5_9TELE
MLWSPRLSLSNFHVKLTAKGLFRNLQLLPGCRKNTVVFHAGLDPSSPSSSNHPVFHPLISSIFPRVVQHSSQTVRCILHIPDHYWENGYFPVYPSTPNPQYLKARY